MRMSLRSKVTTLQQQAIKRLRSENNKTVNRATNQKEYKKDKEKEPLMSCCLTE
jgi:hypothetical protein